MPAETIPLLLRERAAGSPDVAAIVDDHARLTYAELEARSAGIAAELVTRGVGRGHPVALLMPNSADWVVLACAVMRIGAVLVPLSTLLRPPELQRQLATAEVRHLIACEGHRGRDYRADAAALDRGALPALEDVWWRPEIGTRPPWERDLAVVGALEAQVRPADDMVVIFTSGSQSAPKGVIHTHGGALGAVRASLDIRCLRPGERLYMPMPFFWMGGFGTALLATLAAGATLLTEEAPEPGRTLRFLERERVTLFRGWPDQALQLARHPDFAATDLSHLRPGSLDAVLPEHLRGTPGRRAVMFGMTESFGPYAGWPLDRDMPPAGTGSCGKPVDGIDVRIVDPLTGATLPPGETGAIQIGGANLMRGICGRRHEDVFTGDGWYDTGDLGRLEEGFLFFAGRKDDMFKVGGATVYPSEVEAALVSIPQVRRAFATDVAVDGAPRVGAAVLLEEGCDMAVAALAAAARDRLSAFKVPARWLVLSSLGELPTLSSGKVDRPGLRALLGQPQQAVRRPPR